MGIKHFQDLIVWQKAHGLVLMVYKTTNFYPQTERFGLISQMRRSAISICSNIVEGYMKSKKDFVRFLDISRGSLEETKYHLILSKDLNYLGIDQFKCLYDQADEIGKLLYSLKQRLL